MNSSAKCRKLGGLGWFRALEVTGYVTFRQSAYDFLFNFNENYAAILYRFRDIARHLWKVPDLNLPYLHLALP